MGDSFAASDLIMAEMSRGRDDIRSIGRDSELVVGLSCLATRLGGRLARGMLENVFLIRGELMRELRGLEE